MTDRLRSFVGKAALSGALLCLLASPSRSQEPEPALAPCEGVCVPEETFDELVRQQEAYVALDEAVPALKLEPFHITIDHEGRVYYPAFLPGTLTVGEKTYAVSVPLEAVVSKQARKESILGFRYKAAGYVDVLRLDEASRLGAALMAEPLHWRAIGLSAYVGTTSAGFGVSVDLTRNFSAFGGAGMSYFGGALAVPVGVSFSFN